jgi:uncharacterized protein
MLYDNALLSQCYVEGYLATGNADYARVARETLDYALREMTDPAGGFYSTQDADSEGEEGKFFVWTPTEVEAVLGPADAKTFNYVYDVTPEGNFEGHNILNLPKTLDACAKILNCDLDELKTELGRGRQQLFAARESRVHPARDDKVLVAWNGLMIDSMALAAGALDEPRYLEAATAAADFLLTNLRRDDGRLLHSWRQGAARFDAYLDDYACLINALLTLYEASFVERYIDEAARLADLVLALFGDRDRGGFFYTATDHEKLIARQKDLYDNATPSGNSMAATALVRLGKLTGRGDYLSAAEGTLRAAARLMHESPTATGQMLLAYDMYLGPTPEVVILGDLNSTDTAAVLADLRHRYLPNKVLAARQAADAAGSSALSGLFAGKKAIQPEPTVYICQNFACQAPATGKKAALATWDELVKQAGAAHTN